MSSVYSAFFWISLNISSCLSLHLNASYFYWNYDSFLEDMVYDDLATTEYPAGPPQILNDSHCLVKGQQLVCVCISWGDPLPPIIWPFDSLTDYSVTSSSNNQTVSSTITLSAAEYEGSTMQCISRNEHGQVETEILIENSTEESKLTCERKGFETIPPWITAVCFCLNLILIAALVSCIYQRNKTKQKKPCEEMNTYASLRKAEVEDEYSIITSQPK